MHHTDAELDRLEEMLRRLPADNDGMSLSEFDGFCAGLLVCPELIMPGEWLPLVWGENTAPGFKSMDEVQTATNLVMDHYNRVARSLTPPSTGYVPILALDPNSDDTLWELWVAGFEKAMSLRPDCWEKIVESEDEEAAASISMILALHQIDQGTSELKDDAIDELDQKAPELIPRIVATLNRWTKARHISAPRPAAANRNTGPSTNRKVGRNDPCPCGSGRKYKKCCGAN